MSIVSTSSSSSSLPWKQQPWSSTINQTDHDGVVGMYSYQECDRESPVEKQAIRGAVLSVSDTWIAPSFGYNPEYTDEEIVRLDTPIDSYQFFFSEEGTLLRLFHVAGNDKWYLATHRKLDAFQSRWGNDQSFGDLFVDALAVPFPDIPRENRLSHLTDTLSRDSVYVFLVKSHYRWICTPPESPQVIHVGTFMPGGDEGAGESQSHHPFRFDHTQPLAGFPQPKPVTFASWEEVSQTVRNLDPVTYQGVIGFTPQQGAAIKVLNSKYQEYTTIRGNESSLLFRYLSVRMDASIVFALLQLYPEKQTWFLAVETALMKIAFALHVAYINRYVKKQYVVVPSREYQIVKALHAHYMADRQNHRITLPVVHAILHQHPSILHGLIKDHWKSLH